MANLEKIYTALHDNNHIDEDVKRNCISSFEQTKKVVEGQGLEKIVLVVDDQFGRADDPMIPERYGNGQVPGYRFELEDAISHYEDNPVPWDKSRIVKTEVYSADKVLKRVKELNPNIILLDLNFGHQRGYGVEIMKSLYEQARDTPVLMFSSAKGFASLLSNVEFFKVIKKVRHFYVQHFSWSSNSRII